MSTKEWTDELKAEVSEAYLELDPTPETTMDCVKQVADAFDKTVNGVRLILTKQGVYIRKDIAKSSATASSENKPKRVNKAEAIHNLKKAIKAAGHDVDNDICDRLTGKAAVYITGLIK